MRAFRTSSDKTSVADLRIVDRHDAVAATRQDALERVVDAAVLRNGLLARRPDHIGNLRKQRVLGHCPR